MRRFGTYGFVPLYLLFLRRRKAVRRNNMLKLFGRFLLRLSRCGALCRRFWRMRCLYDSLSLCGGNEMLRRTVLRMRRR